MDESLRETIDFKLAFLNDNIISGLTWGVLDSYVTVRNKIVHEYDVITTAFVYSEAHGFVEKLPQFITEVQRYLERQAAQER